MTLLIPKLVRSLGRPRHQTEIVNGAHTRAMSEHRCFPKKRLGLSTRTMHFRCVTGGIRVSVTQPSTPASMQYKVTIWSFSIFNTKNAQKIPKFLSGNPDGREHDQSSYFCRGPDDFCWGPAPVGPTLVTGPALVDGCW